EDARTVRAHQRLVSRRAGAIEIGDDLVRVDGCAAEVFEHPRDGGLAAGDAPRQTNVQSGVKDHPRLRVAACTVLLINTAMVIGPTPPGTGVIQPAISCAAAKSTSPASLPSMRLMPTSITTAPGFTMSAVTKRAFPIAATRTSASRATAPRLCVREWQM